MRDSLILITGVSGAGKSVALKVLEDAGYYCVDNLPAPMVSDLVSHLDAQGETRLAIAIDARSGASVAELPHIVAGLRTFGGASFDANVGEGRDVRVLFLTANTTALVQRFSETRRRHPLSPSLQRPDGHSLSLTEAIEHERELVGDLAELGLTIDTSALSPSKLRAAVKAFVDYDAGGLTLMFESFAFKRGVPLDADLVFDVRFLPNPYYDAALRPLTGLDRPVIDFMQALPDAEQLLDDITRFVAHWLPNYQHDHRSYLTVAIGCTGGQHRSVWMCERLAERLQGHAAHVIVRHREMTERGRDAVGVGAEPSR